MKKLILLLDDDDRCSGLVPFLERDDHIVIRAIGADDTLSLLAQGLTIDLLITEQHLPGTDVMEFLTRLGRIKPGLPVIVVTDGNPPPDPLTAKNLGAVDYLCRPFSMMDALRMVNTILFRAVIGGPVPLTEHAERQDWSTAT